ncbi:MAG: phosphoribosyl-ATP diphosphatase [Limnoraphis sp. WC205]|jgi:phosphoribosyl-ATP pyrophosphohydrolase/phosphoribosyl-AMP cyclohydrolase|nr:phosphoribosyl-ATP diphosphatase [Limnoraphis sp. WC205]
MSASKPLFFSQLLPIDKIRYNEQGLLPAIIQDSLEGRVLTLVWMSPDSLQKTLQEGRVYDSNPSSGELPHLSVTGLRYDPASQSLLILVEPESLAEQQGEFADLASHMMSEVFEVICDRRDHPKEDSYTCKLLAGGDNKILKKIGEESAEVVMACKDNDTEAIASEVADLFYHTLVAIAYHRADLRDVYRKLAERRR